MFTNRMVICASLVALMAGCSDGKKFRISKGKAPTVQTKPRSEPIFYNGKTYRLDYAYAKDRRAFDMRVSGMTKTQEKDAIAVATSSLRYFACIDGQRGQLIGAPAYDGDVWSLQAKCA
ncbi:MAG: hypothetical protein ACT4SY_08835 [Hyphomicrobiales bacterium]